MSQNELPNVMDEVLATLMKASTDWKKQNDEATLRRRAFARLDKSADEIVAKLLGFKPEAGGRWELDHCNGRAGESAAGDFIRRVQSEAIQEWLSSVAMPEISERAMESMKSSARKAYLAQLQRSLDEKARKKAADDATAMVNALGESQNLRRVLEAQALVRGTSPNDSQ